MVISLKDISSSEILTQSIVKLNVNLQVYHLLYVRKMFQRSKRYDSTKSRGSSRNRSSRIAPTNLTRNASYLDDLTLNAMISSGMMETLGPVNFAQVKIRL